MMVKVLVLMYLVNVAARPKMQSARRLQSLGAVVAEDLLAATGGDSCSVVFITDGSTSSFIVTKAWQQWRGAAVFQTDPRNQKNNVTDHLQLVRLARQVRQLSWCTVVVVVSHDPAFLAAFAEWSLRGRLLVWSTRLVVVTRLALPQLRALLPAYWTFAMMNALVLNMEGDSPHLKCVGYTYLPYSPSGATVQQVAVWTPKRGLYLRSDLLPFSEKFVNFHGADVLVTPQPFMPFWGGEQRQAPDGSLLSTLEGSDYQLLVAVAEALNFTIRILPSVSWGDAIQKVEERASFICPVYHIVMSVRVKRHDFTFTHEFSYLSFAMAKPSQKPQWQGLYYPLAEQVWLAVLAALILVPLVYKAVTYIQLKQREYRTSVAAVFQNMTGMLLGQNLPRRLPSTSSSRVLLAAWLVFALILGVAYRGNLTASLTLPKYPSRTETIPQLVEAVER
ncbi:uncharacterized protein LOC126996696 [Eriocheir sinensis]|uniref:uncharacterized protein LOC126996696 n=1 Tax=Eriocheir sinensis TaxID=95602 RepID=UPI0021C98A2B|nr:uncharacterized protein LOC126996696 [Eriocheir sinensis]